MRAGVIAIAAGVAAAMSCKTDATFECGVGYDCGDGFCEATGFCSFEDDTCESGRRYGPQAGDGLAGECSEVPSGGPSGSESGAGAQDSSSSQGDTVSVVDESGGSSTGQPSDDATGTTGPTACGELGEACCDDTGCAAGLCEQGTCAPCRLSISASEYQTCAWRNDGRLACWGSDDFGQLGDGDRMAPPGSPTMVDLEVLDVAVGAQHVCAVAIEGSVHCWGRNDSGQLGLGSLTTTEEHAPVANGLQASHSISAGGLHTCAVTNTDTLWCWGSNIYGQSNPMLPGGVIDAPGATALSAIAAIAAGGFHTCAIAQTNEVGCWGRNDSMQAQASAITPAQPTIIDSLSDVLDVTAGDWHSCAIRDDGDVYCWGRNALGQAGLETNGEDVGEPELVEGVADATQISAGDDHTCALTATGEVWCWGSNVYGQLSGADLEPGGPTPVLVDIAGATMVASGRRHTCAVRDGTSVVCWGDNALGQLGAGDTSESSGPTDAVFNCDWVPG